MQIKFFLLLFLLCTLACKNKEQEKVDNSVLKFDKMKWAEKNGREYPYRDRMLKDLIDNQKLHGLSNEEVFSLLGRPNRIDNGHLFYTIHRKYFANTFVTLHSKTLVIKLNNDTVEWRKIHE